MGDRNYEDLQLQSQLGHIEQRDNSLTSVDGCVPGYHFISHTPNHFGRRPDESYTGVDDCLRKIGILRHEAVTRMDSIHIIFLQIEKRIAEVIREDKMDGRPLTSS